MHIHSSIPEGNIAETLNLDRYFSKRIVSIGLNIKMMSVLSGSESEQSQKSRVRARTRTREEEASSSAQDAFEADANPHLHG